MEEVYDLRIVLEGHAVRLAVPLMTDEDLQVLENLYAEMVDAESGDAKLAARERFYINLYSMTGRPRRDAERAVSQLASHYRRVAILIRRYLRDAAMSEKQSQRTIRDIDVERAARSRRARNRGTDRNATG
ncbi:MAG: FCD domain-containing protein [Chloroflexi bacterium]|nr:MAG: FCD domain-containing protein [Chloroflexota bacterium]